MILTVCPNPSIDTYAWISTIEMGKSNRIERSQEYPGGKGTHVAMAINELGQTNNLSGIWAGASGNWIKRECNLKNITTSGIEIKGQNRKCFTFRSNDKTFNNTELLEPGPTLTPLDWENYISHFKTEVEKSSIICVAGSWPKGTPDNAYSQVIDIAKQYNKRIIVDCSNKHLENIKEKSFFGIHMNEDEACAIFGKASIEAIIDLLYQKIELIAITKGKEGLWLYHKGQLLHANTTINNVISTVGSGDCLTAGITYAVNKNLTTEEIAKYGVACGAANCLNEALGILKKEDVTNLLPKVTVNTIKEYINYAK